MRTPLKYWIILILAILLSMSACVKDEIDPTSSVPTLAVIPGANNGQCGDGNCDGPENPTSCPEDCRSEGSTPKVTGANNSPSENQSLEDISPLYFFYAIHVHASGEYLPYDGPAMQNINPDVADNMISVVEQIAEVLNRHGVKGTWETLPAVASGLCNYQGEEHVFRHLISQGHEVGAHAHRIDDIQDSHNALVEHCGITPETNSGFIAQISSYDDVETQSAMSLAIETSLNLGMGIGTTNLSPGGGKNPFTELCNSQIGIDNDMWHQSGNLMFPWRPDYLQTDICSDNYQGSMILVDHVSIEWILLPGQQRPPDVLADEHFDQLRGLFDGALRFMEQDKPSRIAVWGFVTHITEYAKGSRGENPLDPDSLSALDRFLAYVSSKADSGRVIFATVEEIAEKVE